MSLIQKRVLIEKILSHNNENVLNVNGSHSKELDDTQCNCLVFKRPRSKVLNGVFSHAPEVVTYWIVS